jgi:hypothetical protein
VTVAIVAVADDVDHRGLTSVAAGAPGGEPVHGGGGQDGASIADSLAFTVTTSDSVADCEDAGRLDCGQAARYGGFSGGFTRSSTPAAASWGRELRGAVNVTVVDDDEAGIVVLQINNAMAGGGAVTFGTSEEVSTDSASPLALNATFDNFGSALAAASYGLCLSSEPLGDVVVSVTGLGPWSAASPSTVAFSPANWSTPVAVAVSAGAPTAARPACPSGGSSLRSCDLLAAEGHRNEAVGHAPFSLADPLYNTLDAAAAWQDSQGRTAAAALAGPLASTGRGLAVSARVVHDASEPPSVVEARFGNLLGSVLLTLSGPSDRAGGLVGRFACTAVLNLTRARAATLFGSGNFCTFPSASTLKVGERGCR